MFEAVYPQLHTIARQRLSSENHASESTESIVHECYLRLTRSGIPAIESRSHFFALVSRLMRQILVDHARARMAARRDRRLEVSLDQTPGVVDATPSRTPMLLRLDAALASLAALSPHQAHLIELRYFGGLTAEETAEALGLEMREVRRDLRYAQNWLRREMNATLSS